MYLVKAETKSNPLDELFYGRPVRTHVREFGALFGAIFFAIAAYTIYRQSSATTIGIFSGLGVLFVLSGYLAPPLLHPVWKGWMKFAHVLGIVMTAVLLSILWWLLVVPFGLGAKLFGKKLMDLRFRAAVETYWEPKDPADSDFKLLARQF